MTEKYPADRPGHLDIDAVSAFVDRDFSPDDLAMLAMHLHACPACQREVLEIRTTVVLLAGLPQYTPRRSFCLGHEHARASRRRSRPGANPWSAGNPAQGYPASAMGAPAWGAAWLPGMQAMAVVIGALLLLVTSSDLLGMPPQPAEWLGEPEAVQMEFAAAPPSQLQPVSTAAPAPDAAMAPAPAAMEREAAAGIVAEQAGGTASDDGASEEVLTGADLTGAPAYATSAAIAAVTQAAPTPGVGAGESGAATDAQAPAGGEPSRLRLVQIALAFALAWLVVSIVGLRWVRGVRGASG